jgi:endoglucanase
MIDVNAARNVCAGRIRRWLALLALVAACSSNTTAMSDPRCPAIPTGCQCVAGTAVCGPASGGANAVRSSPEAGVATTTGGSPAAMGGVADAGPHATSGGPGPAGSGGMSGRMDAAAADSGASQADASPSGQDAAAEAGAPSGAVGFVGEHGALRVHGNRVVDQNGQPVQLRGMSLFWSQWSDSYVAKNVDVMVDDWKATVVRAALGVENDGGYLASPEANVAKVRAVVDRAIERGIYVIIDWHDHHAQDHTAQATAFFQAMAKAYGKRPHVIFEVYNEPMGVSWSVVKAYAEPMIGTIRTSGSQNLIVVGTPMWSQDVDIAANDRITSDDNVAYTLHFYANTHKQALRDKAKAALDRGIALFVTEWGTCSADGNGSINVDETRTWLSFLQGQSISWANWTLNNKAEACSAVQPSGGSVGPWRDDQLTPSGLLVKGAIP